MTGVGSGRTLRTKSPHAPLEESEGAGWRLVYDATPSDWQKPAKIRTRP